MSIAYGTITYMPSVERGAGAGHDQGPSKEQKFSPYYLAYKFAGEDLTHQACTLANELISNTEGSELIAFKTRINSGHHVAVIGPRPEGQELEEKLKEMLSQGEPVSLSSMVLKTLWSYRDLLKIWSMD